MKQLSEFQEIDDGKAELTLMAMGVIPYFFRGVV